MYFTEEGEIRAGVASLDCEDLADVFGVLLPIGGRVGKGGGV